MENVGEKSFNPSEFSVYKSTIDFSKVNVWDVFKRKLPGQIALVCHDSDKSVSEISLETGVPAVYIEEEIGLLMDAASRTFFHFSSLLFVKNMIEFIRK